MLEEDCIAYLDTSHGVFDPNADAVAPVHNA